jgi:hypothetical protein
MRMSNDRDQALLRSAVSDTAANLFAFVPSLGTREALAFGVGVPLPTRLTFTALPQHLIPRSEAFAGDRSPIAGIEDIDFIGSVIERWRGSTLTQRSSVEEPRESRPPAVAAEAAPLQPTPAPTAPPPAPEPNRFQPAEEAFGQSGRSICGPADCGAGQSESLAILKTER